MLPLLDAAAELCAGGMMKNGRREGLKMERKEEKQGEGAKSSRSGRAERARTEMGERTGSSAFNSSRPALTLLFTLTLLLKSMASPAWFVHCINTRTSRRAAGSPIRCGESRLPSAQPPPHESTALLIVEATASSPPHSTAYPALSLTFQSLAAFASTRNPSRTPPTTR